MFGTVHYQFWGYWDENLKLATQNYRAWSACMNVQAGLGIYWWQELSLLLVPAGLMQIYIYYSN